MRLLVLLMLLSGPVHANIVLDAQGCASFASWSGDIVWAKSVGADKARVRSSIVEMRQKSRHPLFDLLLRDFEGLWTTAAGFPEVTVAVMNDCYRRRGVYGPAI